MTCASKTPEQQKNFRILLNGLIEMYGDKRFDDHFHMQDFQIDHDGSSVETTGLSITSHSCGTSACMLGHAPMFGINNNLDGQRLEDYSAVFFGVKCEVDCYREWAFLFSGMWSDDIQEAIARLRMYIDGFDPSRESWHYSDRYAS